MKTVLRNEYIDVMSEFLRFVAKERKQVLYACESGSRAWGFESKDSDYDVRYVYVDPIQEILSLDQRKDTIDWCGKANGLVVDAAGWEVKKFIYLLYKGNASPMEWMKSPIVYAQMPEKFKRGCEAMVEKYMDRKKLFYHYRGHARGIYLDIELGIARKQKVSLKKLLYLARTTCAASWVFTHGTSPPIVFAEMLGEPTSSIDEETTNNLIGLILIKKMGREADEIDTLPLYDRLRSRLYWLETLEIKGEADTDTSLANEVYREVYKDAVRLWGDWLDGYA